ncbi:nickel-responsive transcriptional regulator NikR [Dissulfurirhabdus thermomarina]|uniref:Putative nickel-responsive regulator n=1 Tax=Dissulfurirhabdus thermomarina TaxID=1765737 RepID=A0A6N9TW85_DISTH|nr:nickel-responsive transcriptional regulator NikR [Dissulfurirhabdus thermomarina]NDY42746.1 nickel-responsive transcriptional regulator NikR [Dissulfurirhabdus thermomarina]NMX22452.1 nickel-responsive transcriptional regulator NikR [Dissulfurirhabdus thermomarina]
MPRPKKSPALVRFGVSIPGELIRAFDRYLDEREYRNRSEAIRDLIRERLVEQEWELEAEGREVIGTITYVYDHHRRELVDAILEIQHHFPEEVVASQHVHLDHHNCLEVAIVKGGAAALRRLADKLRALKGIKHCQLTMTTTGASLT